MKQSDFRKLIDQAFSTELKSIRTAGGISRDTGLPIEEVIEYLEDHPERYKVMGLRPAGCKLYKVVRK